MSIIKGSARLKHHSLTTAGANFTVPPSEDFTDGTWDANDLVLGEIGINLADDSIFYRTNNGIIELTSQSAISGLWYRDGDDIRAIGLDVTSPTTNPNVLPTDDDVCNLGSPSLRWKNLYLVNTTTEELETTATVSHGGASRYQTQYFGRFTAQKTGASTGAVAIVIGEDAAGNPMTIGGTYNSSSATVTVTLPTPMSSTNIVCVAAKDGSDANDYPWTVFCTNRSTTTLVFTVIRVDGAAWSSGTIECGFIAYSQ